MRIIYIVSSITPITQIEQMREHLEKKKDVIVGADLVIRKGNTYFIITDRGNIVYQDLGD